MDALFECLGKEFSGVEFTSMNIKPSHSVNYSKNGTEENIITLTISVYNSVHDQVGRKIINIKLRQLKSLIMLYQKNWTRLSFFQRMLYLMKYIKIIEKNLEKLMISYKIY